MQSLETQSCPDCSVPLLDAGDELACPSCGVVKEKAATCTATGSQPDQRYGPQPLGSFMGKVKVSARQASIDAEVTTVLPFIASYAMTKRGRR